MPDSAFIIRKPSSISYAGTFASVNEFGRVSFSGLTSLSLDGVFSSTYDNYMVVLRGTGSGSFNQVRLRSAGADATGTDYVNQALSASGTTVAGARSTLSLFRFSVFEGTLRGGVTGFFYGPALAQPTAMRCVTVRDTSSAMIEDNAGTHSLSTSYDGFTIYPASGTFTGAIAVYGCNQ